MYELLDAGRGCSPADLRRAYRQQLVTAHPDKGGSAAGFQQLQHAYAVLSDPAERAIYDESLARRGGTSGQPQPQPPPGARVLRPAPGVTAWVHGQSELPAGEAASGGAERGSSCGTGAALPPSDSQAAERLAAGHLQAAQACQSEGRLHHATFHAQEAAALRPGWAEAGALLVELERAAGGSQGAASSGASDDSGLE